MRKEFSKLCTPAKIYFAIAIIASIIALFNGFTIISVAVKLLFAFIWTILLAWLCDNGFKTLSWFLVLLPYIIIALASFGIFYMSRQQKNIMHNLQIQGPFGKPYVQ